MSLLINEKTFSDRGSGFVDKVSIAGGGHNNFQFFKSTWYLY